MTHDPREIQWRQDDRHILKAAFCNTGDEVLSRKWSNRRQWRNAHMNAWLRPNRWIVQRRFDVLPIPSPLGDRIPCIGVYTINGRAAGAYSRLSGGPVVDYQAVDAALLVESEEYRV